MWTSSEIHMSIKCRLVLNIFLNLFQILLTIVYMYVYITIPRFAEISLKTVGIIPLGLVITISFLLLMHA